VLTKKEIQKARNKWIIRVVVAFVIITAIMFGIERVQRFYRLPEIYVQIILVIFGAFYLLQISSYRRIRCPNCGSPLLTGYGILMPIPKECRQCKAKIE
jgi:hypothetical protein